MKRKYIYILAIAVVLVAMLAIPAMQKPKVTVPENPFPISEEAINTAIKNAGLELTIGEKTDLSNAVINSVSYFLMNDNNKAECILVISYDDKIKSLSVLTLYHHLLQGATSSISDLLPEEDFPKLVHMATELYGGFSDNSTPYNTFQKDGFPNIWEKKLDSDIICTMGGINDPRSPDKFMQTQFYIANSAYLESNIESKEKTIAQTEERLKNFPERDTKEERDRLQDYKDSLERLKAIK